MISQGDAFSQEDFPFSFRAVLDDANRVASLSDVSVDLSSSSLDNDGLAASGSSPEAQGQAVDS